MQDARPSGERAASARDARRGINFENRTRSDLQAMERAEGQIAKAAKMLDELSHAAIPADKFGIKNPTRPQPTDIKVEGRAPRFRCGVSAGVGR